jgi:hypothetical protein
MKLLDILAAADIFGYDIVIDGDTMQAHVFMGEAYSHSFEVR